MENLVVREGICDGPSDRECADRARVSHEHPLGEVWHGTEGELERGVGPAPSAGVARPSENRFDPLAALGSTEFVQPDILRGTAGRQFARVAREFHTYARKHSRPEAKAKPQWMPEGAEDTAHGFRKLIYDYVDWGYADISVPVPKCGTAAVYGRYALWDRIALHRLRFGKDRKAYVRVRRSDRRGRPLLTWADPGPGCYDDDHARRQASVNDDGVIHRSALRVNVEALRRHGAPDAELARVLDGYEVALHTEPRRYHGRNYGGALEHPDKVAAETQRMVEQGFVEGPLLYTPHIVQGLGGVWKPEKDKWRTIVNGTSSGVNPASIPLGAEYDMLADVLGPLRPGMRLSGFDITDAFLNWPYTQEDSDLWGFRTVDGYFRYRFMAFGGSQSPSVQQRWARIFKAIINQHGLKHCTGRAADYSTFRCTGAYLDDFNMQHAAELTDEECLEQYHSVLALLRELGVDYKPSKNVLPSTSALYVGFVIDTVAQTVNITPERAAALDLEVASLLERVPAGSPVGRRELARLVGKLQWVAQIATHGQRLLRELYRTRDCFVDDAVRALSLRDQWRDSVMVTLTVEAAAELGQWRLRLAELPGTPVFLTNLATPSGFWRGAVPESDEELDREGNLGASVEDVEVLTGDASGRACGGWYGPERLVHLFDSAECAPTRSSNFRELKTVLLMLQRWGTQLRGRRVLVRTDNTTTACAVNRGYAKHEGLEDLAEAIRALAASLEISLAARHVPGLKNGLADALSRVLHTVEGPDRSDLRLRRDELEWLESVVGSPFDVDTCADVRGDNAHCRRFYSVADDALSHDWGGHLSWCHPDWEMIDPLLRHYREAHAREPTATGAVFLVPAWTWAPWWRRVRGFEVLAHYPAGSQLLTRPLRPASAQSDGPSARAGLASGTKWPMIAIRHGCRSGAAPGTQRDALRGGRRRAAPGDGACGPGNNLDVRPPTLLGDGDHDSGLLRGLLPRAVPQLRRRHH